MKKKSAKLPCGRPAPHEEVHPDDDLLSELREKLSAYVTARGLNRSDARDKILETIVFEAMHFKPQDLLDRLRRRHPSVGKATLYRNLPVLVESGVLQEGPTASDGSVMYELSGREHHDHVVCRDCGRIFEFHDRTIENRQDAVTRDMGFTARHHRHVIYADCSYLKRR